MQFSNRWYCFSILDLSSELSRSIYVHDSNLIIFTTQMTVISSRPEGICDICGSKPLEDSLKVWRHRNLAMQPGAKVGVARSQVQVDIQCSCAISLRYLLGNETRTSYLKWFKSYEQQIRCRKSVAKPLPALL